MAQVQRTELGVLHEKISITVGKDDYMGNFEKALKKYSKQANVPGFRPGMVPTSLLKKMYGEALFQEEVINTADREIQAYFEKEKIEFFASPLPLDETPVDINFNNPSDYTFNFEIGLRPTIEVADLSKGSFVNYKIGVTEKMLDEEVANIQKKQSTLEEATTVATAEDTLTCVLKISETGHTVENVEIPVSYFKEDFRSQVINKELNNSLAFTLNEAFGTTEQNFIKKELDIEKADETASDANYEATITGIKTKVLAPVDEKLFETTFPGKDIKTLEAFKAELTKDIEAYFEGVAKGNISDQAYNYWMDNTAITLPETFLKNWVQKGQEKPISAEQAEEEYPKFEKSLKWTLISNQVASHNNISVDKEDIKKHAINQLFSYYGGGMGMDIEAPWVQEFANKMLSDKKFVNDASERVLQDKIFNWAEANITATPKDISLEDFEALRKNA
jgi:trigger factor